MATYSYYMVYIILDDYFKLEWKFFFFNFFNFGMFVITISK